LSDLVEILSGDRPGLENLGAAAAKFGEAYSYGEGRGLPLWRFFSCRLSRPLFCEIGDFVGEPFAVDNVGVEVVGDPFFDFDVTLVLRIADGLEDLCVAPRAATVFGRTATASLDQTPIGNARLGIE